ncbi:MAG: LytTR family transcriptional regulator [Prevotella sp.]|nr:LytTR family transcriptional regulator [Prevotella sp.]
MPSDPNIVLSAHDELFIIDLAKVLFMKADDHYTDVHYATGAHFLVPFGLVKIEARIAALPDAQPTLVRLGRKYIVNTRRIFRINTVKELLYLTCDDGTTQSIHIPKPVLRDLIETMSRQINNTPAQQE